MHVDSRLAEVTRSLFPPLRQALRTREVELKDGDSMVTIPVLEDPTIGPAGVVWDASIVLAQHVLDAGLGNSAIHASGNSGSRGCGIASGGGSDNSHWACVGGSLRVVELGAQISL